VGEGAGRRGRESERSRPPVRACRSSSQLPPSATAATLPPRAQGKTNFFEKRVGEYSRAGVGANKEQQVFSLNEDF
jgi:hypothetical protein